MTKKNLLTAMDRIALSLITTVKGGEFYSQTRDFVNETKAEQPFVWFITEELSATYNILPGTNWLAPLLSMMERAQRKEEEYILYVYDYMKIVPVFPRMIRDQAQSMKKH